MTPYRIGLLGLGTVGRSYVDLLSQFGDECARAAGRPLEVRRVVVRDLERAREFLGTNDTVQLCDDPATVIGAEDIDVVVELVGGEEPAREWISRALAAGQDVVTANKAVLAAHGETLFATAHQHQQSLLFEGAVAGAIPILQVIREGLTAGPITALTGILNGSTNWLLGQLDAGRSWDDALAEASRLGLVEADPTLDVSGKDAAHKLALMARLLTGRTVDLDAIRCQGIDALRPEDLAFGRRHGLALKLVATMRSDGGAADLGVYPQWLRTDHPLASVRDENNAILLEGPTFGELVFQGRGAGGDPTAGSVIADTARAARGAGQIDGSQGHLTVRDP
ncbi:MAG: homoserine dehydrogenase, partial [Planctomycetota bacterium]